MRRLFEGGAYSGAVLIRGRRLFEGGAYSGAVLIRVNTVSVKITQVADFVGNV